MPDNDYFSLTREGQLRAFVAGNMLKGAGWAAVLVLGFGLVLALIWLVGTYLPAESRDTPDPNTWSSLELPAAGAAA